MKSKAIKPTTDVNIEALKEAFKGDLDLMLFYVAWVKNGLNASKAYKELHPEVTNASSRVLGSQALTKINKEAVMQAYGLDHQAYYIQLAEGLQANKSDMTGQVYPDHKTRRDYHKTLGTLLGIESNTPSTAVQINNNIDLDKYIK